MEYSAQTPEEKLLQYIKENTHKKGDADILLSQKKGFRLFYFIRSRANHLSFYPPIKKLATFFKFRLPLKKNAAHKKYLLSIKKIFLTPTSQALNLCFVVAALSMAFFFFLLYKPHTLYYFYPHIPEMREASTKPYLFQPTNKHLLTDYAGISQRKDFLRVYRSQQKIKETTQTVSITDLTKSLTLNGVLLDDEPQAVIMDTKTRKTTTVKTGDTIEELTVKSIQRGKVVLTYEDQTKELTL